MVPQVAAAVLALVFAAAAATKLYGLTKGQRFKLLAKLPVHTPRRAMALASTLAAFEALSALLLLTAVRLGAGLSLALLIGYSGYLISRPSSVECACFGGRLSFGGSKWSAVARNGVLILTAGLVVASPASPSISALSLGCMALAVALALDVAVLPTTPASILPSNKGVVHGSE